MSLSLTIRGGRPCFELEDHTGEVWTYRYEVLADTRSRYAVRVTKLEHPDEPTYLVQIGPNWHRCDCLDYACRRRRVGERCKHLEAAYSLRDLLRALLPAAQPEEQHHAHQHPGLASRTVRP